MIHREFKGSWDFGKDDLVDVLNEIPFDFSAKIGVRAENGIDGEATEIFVCIFV